MSATLYYGQCSQTNIGNAFLDYGSQYSIRKANPGTTLHTASELNRWFMENNFTPKNRAVDIAEMSDVDYVVVSGMVLYDEFLRLEGPVIRKMSERGTKIIFNACGGGYNRPDEVKRVKKFIDKINKIGFISRDKHVYDIYKKMFPISYNGIDCAFFLPDFFRPIHFLNKNYIVLNFDEIDYPNIESEYDMYFSHHHVADFYSNCETVPGFRVTAKNRFPWFEVRKTGRNRKYFMKDKILISNNPDDYINLYANAKEVYTDKIHTSIVSLSFDTPVRLYSARINSQRHNILQNVRADSITKELSRLDVDWFRKKKEEQLSILKDIFAL